MGAGNEQDSYSSFLGTGWAFPPEFPRETGEARMSSDEQDIAESLTILFRTSVGERLFHPDYGLEMHELLFEPMSTTMRTFVADRVKIALLFHEPRIDVDFVTIDSPDSSEGTLRIAVDYRIRATNSRYNLVFPFYRSDGNELRASIDGPRG